MKIEHHLENLKESLSEIENAIKSGLVNKQRSLGFHASRVCVDMLEMHLHKLGLLPEDNLIKHEWLLSKNKLKEKLPFEFKFKEDILLLIEAVESRRNNFCYGKRRSFEELSALVEDFNKVKKKFEGLGLAFETENEEG